MNKEEILELKDYLIQGGEVLPQYVDKEPLHWNSRLYMAQVLQKLGKKEEAYAVMRKIYEENIFRFDKGIHGAYEEYIVEKVRFFENLARLSFEVTHEPARSIPYLDEALIMLDGAESVYPYVSPSEIKHLKNTYLSI
ncbi:hypothetical protein CS063_03095 [Sporanaerobium hydrogeniformans]|uniref:Uncharacterized protein n=1 Tax=Sporanaerobium hydrogeniformans TaxID=3072179 RepID=A0AC61DEU0_9FIRM|nr:hypothetical protein [Sporanaerobium hydrogeniformans]PHV71568.1 hypothetical protein CS063_03095 [Sporanaerobium hydrogeniformans]